VAVLSHLTTGSGRLDLSEWRKVRVTSIPPPIVAKRSRQRRSNGVDDHATCTSWWSMTRKFRTPRQYWASSASVNQTNASRAQFAAPQWMRGTALVLVGV
jgi:hypothetical protein